MNQPSHGAEPDLDIASVQRQLGLPPNFVTWLDGMEQVATTPPVLPSDCDAAELLQLLGVDSADRVSTLAARPDPVAHPELWWVLDRAYRDLIATMGTPPEWGGWPELPLRTGPVGRHLYIWLCLAVLPYVRHYHQGQGIPEQISWASLAGLGREMAKTRELSEAPGVESSWMLPRTFRGASYRLGRLVFERGQPEPAHSRHEVLRPGEISLGTHIPGTGEPLDPDSCDDSFSTAQDFFARHFGEYPVAFNCHSWLMDGQLTTYLPASSNIIRFQHLFTYFNDSEPGDHEILEHVFHRRCHESPVPAELLDELPQETTLQRGIFSHLRSGGHWYNQTGWLRVESKTRRAAD